MQEPSFSVRDSEPADVPAITAHLEAHGVAPGPVQRRYGADVEGYVLPEGARYLPVVGGAG